MAAPASMLGGNIMSVAIAFWLAPEQSVQVGSDRLQCDPSMGLYVIWVGHACGGRRRVPEGREMGCSADRAFSRQVAAPSSATSW